MVSLNLTYIDYSAHLTIGLHQLLETAHNADVTFAVEGRFIKSHQIILSMFSTYFKELFAANPCPHPIFFMKDVSYRMMKNILNFIYVGEVQIPEEDFRSFVDIADALKVKGLKDLTKVSESPSFEEHKNEQVDNNIKLSLNHMMQLREDTNKTLQSIPTYEEILGNVDEQNDNSMDIVESQRLLPGHSGMFLPDDKPFVFHGNELDQKDIKLHNDNINDHVTVTFVKSLGGKAIIVNNYRYCGHSGNSKHSQLYVCTKNLSKKCSARLRLTPDRQIIFLNSHVSNCGFNRRKWMEDEIVKKLTYRVATIQELNRRSPRSLNNTYS